MARTLTLLCLAAAVAWPASAASARVWQPPQTLNNPATTANGPHVVTTALDEVVTVYIEQDKDDAFPIRMMARVKRADGTLEPAQQLAPEVAGCVLDLATDGVGGVIASWQLPDGTIKVSRRPAGGVFGPAEVVRSGWNSGGSSPVLAMNARGDAALFWEAFHPGNAVEPLGYTSYQASFSPAGGPFGPVEDLTAREPAAWGGYDAALTPDGSLVAVWAANPDNGGRSRVATVTRLADGSVTPVQELAQVDGTESCPQVAADAQGRIAAIWHEIDSSQCLELGHDLVAYKLPGQPFQAPFEVPGSAGQASRGELAVGDAGQIAIAYSGWNGGHVVTGSFDSPLVESQQFPSSADPPSLAGAPNGEVVFAPTWGSGLQSGRIAAAGASSPLQDLRADCAEVHATRLSVNQHGKAAALMMVDGGGLQLQVDAPSDGPPPHRCAGPGPTPAPAPTSHAPIGGPSPSQTGLRLSQRVLGSSARGRQGRLRLLIHCGAPCTAQATGVVRAGRRRARLSGRRTLRDGRAVVTLPFSLPRKASGLRRGTRLSVTLSVTATDRQGARTLQRIRTSTRIGRRTR